MSAAIAFKNACKRYWGPRSSGVVPEFYINDGDKAIIRDNILEVIVLQEQNIRRKQQIEALVRIAEYDYPLVWTNLIPAIVNNMKSGDIPRMFRSLVPLRY